MPLRPAGQVRNYDCESFLGAIMKYKLTREARPLFKACGPIWNHSDQMAQRHCEDLEHITDKKFSGSYGEAARAVRRYLMGAHCLRRKNGLQMSASRSASRHDTRA